MAAKKSRKPMKVPAKGRTQSRKITRGPNKGDTVKVKGAGRGNFYPVRHVKDVGPKSTSRSARRKKR